MLLRFAEFGRPAQTITCGLGGMGIRARLFVRMPRGLPEARRSARSLPEGLPRHPAALDGTCGVEFIEAAVASNAAGGARRDCTRAV